MKKIMTFIAAVFTLCCMAQAQTISNVSGVTLSGSGADPTIENHTNKGIVAAFLTYPTIIGDAEPVQQLFISSGEVPANGSMKLNSLNSREMKRFDSSRKTTLNAVVFSDGELRGLDSLDFQTTVEGMFQSTKMAFDLAKAGNWDKVKAKAEAKGPDVAGRAAARKLLNIHNSGGDINQLARYGNLPTVIWKSSSPQGSLWGRVWQVRNPIEGSGEGMGPPSFQIRRRGNQVRLL